MGMAFNAANGSAKKSGLDYIKLELGENTFRMVGEILPRYCYWKKLGDHNIPVECLAFDRAKERFTNVEKDWFKHYFKEEKCVWSYVIQVIDSKDGKLKLMGLKKKLFDQVLDLANDLGDPTDPITGWDVIVEKKKTGPHIFNIEYKLKERAIEKRPLTDEEKVEFDKVKPIDELIPRQDPEEQKAFIESSWVNGEAEETNTDDSAVDEFNETSKPNNDFDDDIPF